MKQNKLTTAITLLIGVSLTGIHSAQAGGNITVDSTSDQPEAGLITLREAIEQANSDPGSTVTFDETLFSNPQTITLQNGDLNVFSDMTITGPGAELLTIDGDNLSRVLTIDSSLNTGRYVDFNSGGSEDIQVTVSGITFTQGNGESTTNNTRGGCISTFDNLILTNSVVTGCTGSNGGGIFSRADALTIENSTISHNTASNKGGGVYRSGGSSEILNSTITGNSSDKGGGIYLTQTGVAFLNSTISNNQADEGRGGGIELVSGSPRTIIKNSTILNNIGIGLSVRNTEMHNTIIAGNTGGDCSFFNNSSDNQNNLDTDGSCDVEAINHTTVTDAMLGPLSDNGGLTLTHAPLVGSPVIDVGDDFLCNEFDQRGESRPRDGDADGTPTCDIGAVEFDFELDEVIFRNSFEDPLG